MSVSFLDTKEKIIGCIFSFLGTKEKINFLKTDLVSDEFIKKIPNKIWVEISRHDPDESYLTLNFILKFN